jgi:hypothetical protein
MGLRVPVWARQSSSHTASAGSCHSAVGVGVEATAAAALATHNLLRQERPPLARLATARPTSLTW